jgi:hypothetical protein
MSTIYSKWELSTVMLELQQELTNREMLDPEVTWTISTKDWTPVRLELQYKVRPDSTTTYKYFTGESVSDMDNMVIEARQYMKALKSREELDHDEFMLMLGRVMDRAKELGMDEDFVNPLTAMMKKLATNAITSSL